MNRVGKVVSCSKGFAMVEMNRTTACSGCTGCGNEQDDSGDVQIRVLNELSAGKGDIVEINMDTQNVLLAALIAYGLPFFGLIIGIVGGQLIFNNELISALTGFGLLGLTYFLISLNEKKFHLSENYVPCIVKIHQKYQDVCFIVE